MRAQLPLLDCGRSTCLIVRCLSLTARWARSGVVDYWRLYALDPVYEELLTLPSIYNICQRAIIEGRGGPDMQPHPGELVWASPRHVVRLL